MTMRDVLTAIADPAEAPGMSAYMKNRFPFLGVKSKPRRDAQKPFIASMRDATSSQLLDAAEALWAEPEREFQYVACDLLRRYQRKLVADDLPRLRKLIADKAWWDTVDILAARVLGPLVLRAGLQPQMDDWVHEPDLWIARAAMLHQLNYKEQTDADRLFAYCEAQAAHRDFFMRKAIGWVLRQYGRTDPDAVRAFVAAHHDELSGLSRREALKHLR